MHKIIKMECASDGSNDCEFAIEIEEGLFYINKEGYIRFSYIDSDDEGKYVIDYLFEKELTFDDIKAVEGSCNEHEDYGTIKVTFEDGKVMEDINIDTFKYAFA